MALLEQVPELSDYWTAAQFELGEISHARRELPQARDHFQAIVIRYAERHPDRRSRRKGQWDPVVPLAIDRLQRMGVPTPEPPVQPKCRRGEWQRRCADDPFGVFW